ncbi:hypothetical protein BX600DRAFT_156434 [Xylariales sp. PMI_506]|nr:hypothetical protein BX600DRAFT_156434 [Xylariales sp. PMI_506]
MEFLAIGFSMIPSSVMRSLVEQDIPSLLLDNLLLALLLTWKPSTWTIISLSLALFLGLASFEHRAEHMHSKYNDRELNPATATNSSHHPPNDTKRAQLHTLNSNAGLCPVSMSTLFGLGSHSTTQPIPSGEEKIIEGSTDYGREPKELHGQPILFPCHLRHRRMTQFKDNFNHSYLYCGIPVGLHACYSPILCVDQVPDPKSKWPFQRAWFSLRPQDHLIRGAKHMTMSQKLREFLISEGADPSEWAYAYLVAVPCVNGKVDNPLGFWYLYSAEKVLTAIIPELNTSYGERRMWLVRQALPPKPEGEPRSTSPYSFRGHFGKDIHVSPFMPPTGGYTIDTCDPCASTSNQLDILVTLTKPEGGPAMVTRVTSRAPGLDVSEASLREKLSFILLWWYIPTCTFMTYRILAEAARIYLKAPSTWSRPEPLKTALGKPARVVEKIIERSFRLFLKESIENQPFPISVTYITPGEHSRKSETFHSLARLDERNKTLDDSTTPPSSPTAASSPQPILFQVISPIFYSRFVHYHTSYEAFTSELLDDERTRTAWSSDPELFASIFGSTSNPKNTQLNLVEENNPDKILSSPTWQWSFLSLLRRAPVPTNFPRKAAYSPFKGISEFDNFVQSHSSQVEAREYRRATLRVFLSEWIGGVQFGPLRGFSDDFEPFGLTRDAVLKIYDAAFKAMILTGAVEAIDLVVKERGTLGWTVGAVSWGVASLNLWASIKAAL